MRLFPSEAFDDRSCLFKFAYRSRMNPYGGIEVVFFFVCFYFVQCFFLASYKQFCFSVSEESRDV